MSTNRLANNAGFTLAELLISLAIAGIIATAALQIFTTTTRTTTAQTNLSEAQQNLRAAMDRLAQHTRSAGFGLPDRGGFSLTFGTNTFTRAATVTNSSTGPDSLTLVGIGYDAGELEPFVTGSECNAAGKDCLTLSSADSVLANALYISVGGASFREVSSVVGKKITLTEQLDLPDDFFKITPPPSIYIIQALRYTIATDLTGCSTLHPCLAVQDLSGVTGSGNRQVLAQGIEDLQIGIFITPPAGGSASFSDGSTTSSADISALRLNLVGKTKTPDKAPIFQRPALEDRDAGSFDLFRRRVLTTVVKIRNPRPDS